MKTTIQFCAEITRMLEAGGYDLAKLLKSCQDAAGDVTAVEGDAKRSALNLKAKGTEVHWRETLPLEYKGKHNSPLAFVSWNDYVARGVKLHGSPSGEMTPDSIPSALRIWVETKFKSAKADDKAPEDNGRGVKPAKGSNGRGVKPEETPAPVK